MTTTILMSAENPEGHRLEDLLAKLQREMETKTARIAGDHRHQAATVRAHNREIIVLLKNAEALQRESYRVLATLGPDEGPLGSPRIGQGE